MIKEHCYVNMNRTVRITFVVLIFFYILIDKAKSQPGKISNVDFFYRFIESNEDRLSALENIQKLRNKLSDTLFVEKYKEDTLWLIKHREALYLNFLCYDYASGLSGNNLCLKELGFKSYQLFYEFKELKGFPQTSQYESKYKEAKYKQKMVCIKIYIQNNSDIKQIPQSACGCIKIIKELKEEQDEELITSELHNKKTIEAKIFQRQTEIQDSIARLNQQISYEPIYFSNGILRVDSIYKINSTNIDSLNIFLVREMLQASNKVFSYYVNSCASKNIERMLEILQSGNNATFYWNIKLKKINGVLTLTDEVPLNSLANQMLLKLVSELYLKDVARFIQESELLFLPFKVSRNGHYTDNRTVEYKIENGFLNIILPVIIDDPKQLVPEISPQEYEQSEFERKKG